MRFPQRSGRACFNNSGNCATLVEDKGAGDSEGERKEGNVEVKLGTKNGGTVTGKWSDLADMLERRKVDLLCM